MAKKLEEQPPSKQPQVAISRFDAAARVIKELKEPTGLTRLNDAADTAFVKAGGKSNLKLSLWSTRQAVKAAERFGLVVVSREEVTITPRVS